jgi:hypothetical protein
MRALDPRNHPGCHRRARRMCFALLSCAGLTRGCPVWILRKIAEHQATRGLASLCGGEDCVRALPHLSGDEKEGPGLDG